MIGSIHLKSVSLDSLSSIRHETSVSVEPSRRTPEFLVIRYQGIYQAGSAGHCDALYIVATATAAPAAWYSTATILDFRELAYMWGDEMQWVTSITWDRVTRCHAPFAIVIGDNCGPAMRSLLRDKYEENCVSTLEEAYETCRIKAKRYAQHLRDWRPASDKALTNDEI